MKKIMTLCLAVGLMAGLAVNASAADYEFSTGDSTEYYGSTNYEDQYDLSLIHLSEPTRH